MAKIKFGMMMTDARGKLGGQVFSKNRAGAYIRTKVTPSNARTGRQSFIRAALARISANWSTLDQSARDGFDSAVNQWQSTNIFGDVVNPTGKSLFVKLNMNLANSEQLEIDAVPDKAIIPEVNLVSVDADAGNLLMNLAGNKVGIKLVVSATAPQSNGTSFYKGKYRQIGVISGSINDTVDITDLYAAKFGKPADSANVSFSLIIVLPNGQASIPQTARMVEI